MGVANALILMVLLYGGGGYLTALLLRGGLTKTSDQVILGVLLPLLVAVLVFLARMIRDDRRADSPPERPADPKLFTVIFAFAFLAGAAMGWWKLLA